MMDQKEPRVLSVLELTRYIKGRMESDPNLANVWVRGEISNFTHHTSGHMYFTLKDAGSRIKAIMFVSHNRRLPFIPKDGTKVIANGHISIYERDGQYQLYVTQMQPDGIGSLYLAFEQLKQKLAAEGLFAAEAKKPIPKFPRAVGVITSPTGAAIRDIITTLQRRNPAVHILLYPVLVQGTQAAASIVRAIEVMNERNEVDVLIVGRGGGSLEELWAFNEEPVARAIYASRIPIISAVGHETDFTIADFVADLRAATPTAAAELAVPHALELKQQLAYAEQSLLRGLKRMLDRQKERLARLQRSPALLYPERLLQQPAERLDRLQERLRYLVRERAAEAKRLVLQLDHQLAAHQPHEQIRYARQRNLVAARSLNMAMRGIARAKRAELAAKIRELDALSPLKVMQRGYSLVYDEKQTKLIRSIRELQIGDMIKIRLNDGKLDCHIWGMEEIKDGQ